MLKKYISLLICFLVLSIYSQNKVLFYSKETRNLPRVNIPLLSESEMIRASNSFINNFKKITGDLLNIERSDNLNKKYNYVILRINPTQKFNFCYYLKDNNLFIQGKNGESLNFGINAFFEEISSLNYLTQKKYNLKKLNKIDLPEKYSKCFYPDFEYREPYFSNNFSEDFRSWNRTNFLELEWGIWGHNLPKVLKKYNLSESAYAKVGKKRTRDQFCFTSDTLFKYVNKAVKNIYNSDFSLNKYMILPNDNNIVCTCEKCKAIGNTKNDAAPSVFYFLNRLAKDNPKSNFFTAAYASVKEVPKIKPEKNIGIFYSTINIQEGIPIINSKHLNKFKSTIENWSNYVNNVYIWDYAVNFDNYFDIYPSIKVTKQNLKLYKELGVKGVFIHGSEYNYSSFQELKSLLYAKLLWDIDTNISDEIKQYFNDKYSSSLSIKLFNFYNYIEDSFLNNSSKLGIYSGIKETSKKYLNPKIFFGFYNDFAAYIDFNKYDKNFLKLTTALTFLKLEIMRDNGLSKFGYGSLINDEIIIKNEVGNLLNRLEKLSRISKLETYNELNFRIDDYIKNWRKKIFTNHKVKHFFYKKPFEIVSNLDEDYQDKSLLNDAAFGLLDYNTNWLINSIDNLKLKINRKDIINSNKIVFSFLQDTKHKIYYPSAIEILNKNEDVLKKIYLDKDLTKLDTKQVIVDIPNKYERKQLSDIFYIKILRSKKNGKNSMACDEIIFK